MFSPLAQQPLEVAFPPAGVFVLESRHDRSFRMADTVHDFLKLVYVFAGRGELVRGARREPLDAGDIALIPAGCRHRIEDRTPVSLYAVCVRADILRAAAGIAGELGNARVWRRVHGAAEWRGLIRQLLHEQTLRREGSEALTLGLTWLLVGRLLRGTGRGRRGPALPDTGLAAARVAAHARELERTFFEVRRIDDAAAALGLSRRRFTQLFRAAAGDSWLNVVKRHRLAHARRLLAETHRSVASICYECGFDDLSNFYRTFRAAEETSPDLWRRRRVARESRG